MIIRRQMSTDQGFKTTGFYLHTHWAYHYPFAVRSWERSDFAGMYHLLRSMDFDRVMIWPISEALPPPLSLEDAQYLDERSVILEDAHAAGLECWVAFAPAISTNPEIRLSPVRQRHFNLHTRTFHLNDPIERSTYLSHLANILERLNNADGYVFIDGDPGGYPGARPQEFCDLLHQAREILGQVRPGQARPAKVIAWLWSGWGADWSSTPPWTQDFRPLSAGVLQHIQRDPPGEPWELLPGRSYIDGWANGRINFRLVEEAGLLHRSTLMTYEIIEFEPVPPALTLQFDAIRRVLRQELRLADNVNGIFANAQQPVMPLPNLYFFARAAKDPGYLDQPDEQVLRDFANLLGGPADLLLPAWRCLDLAQAELAPDLPQRLRNVRLTGSASTGIPGGPERYVDILAHHYETWRTVQMSCAGPFPPDAEASQRIAQAILALDRWHQVHGFCGAGNGLRFAWEYCHPRLLQPLCSMVRTNLAESARLQDRLAGLLTDSGRFSREEASRLIAPLLHGEVKSVQPGSQPHNHFD
jgi:hypothetical protein